MPAPDHETSPGLASASPKVTVRPYREGDRQAVRDLCCDTGFLGKPIDPVFEDRELFADFLTRPYTDLEPECCFVLEREGRVVGYLLGARSRCGMRISGIWPILVSALKLLWRYPGYRPASRAYVRWLLTKGWRETPEAPKDAAHFHINVLPEARKLATSLPLLDAFFAHLRTCGEKRVYGQMSTFESRRGEAMFERLGFKVMNRKEITKYRDFTSERIYLSTCVRELDPGDENSYTVRLRRAGKPVSRSTSKNS